jgi:hypothetical protein
MFSLRNRGDEDTLTFRVRRLVFDDFIVSCFSHRIDCCEVTSRSTVPSPIVCIFNAGGARRSGPSLPTSMSELVRGTGWSPDADAPEARDPFF